MNCEAQLFFESIQNFMQTPEMEQEIEKSVLTVEIIAFELVALNTRFYEENILVIEIHYANKESQDLRYL